MEYKNVPVLQEGAGFYPERVTGKADVEIDEARKTAVIIVTTTEGSMLYDFLRAGTLRSLSMGGFVDHLDPESEAYKNYMKKNEAAPRDHA